MPPTVAATTLVEIRDFLRRRSCAPAPWETPQGAVDRLRAALAAKRDDELFWRDLKDLTRRLEDRRFDRTALRGSQALGEAATDQLLDELRAALDGDGPNALPAERPARNGGGRALAGVALLGFLLLGAALGCDDGESDLCGDAIAAKIPGDDGVVYCELMDIIRRADISKADKHYFMECLPDLDATYRAHLLHLFERMSDHDIAAYLEYNDICWPPDDDYGDASSH
jgi:hypothetical protein